MSSKLTYSTMSHRLPCLAGKPALLCRTHITGLSGVPG